MVTWGGGGYIRYGLQFGSGGDVGAKFRAARTGEYSGMRTMTNNTTTMSQKQMNMSFNAKLIIG